MLQLVDQSPHEMLSSHPSHHTTCLPIMRQPVSGTDIVKHSKRKQPSMSWYLSTWPHCTPAVETVEKVSRDSVLERTATGLSLSFLPSRKVTGPSWACFFLQQMESAKLSNTWVITSTVSGTAPGTHLLSHVILSFQSQTRNTGGDRAVGKREAYVTLKYHMLALIHSVCLFVKYTCSTVSLSLCRYPSRIHFNVSMLGGVWDTASD